jgi:uncharacterized delta-60 repeat protein
VTTHFGRESFDYAIAAAIQANGKIVAAGSTQPSNDLVKLALARYKPDGTLDTAFGPNGTVTVRFGDVIYSAAYDVAIQADGKIVTAGVAGGFGRTKSKFAPIPGELREKTRGTPLVGVGALVSRITWLQPPLNAPRAELSRLPLLLGGSAAQ